MVLSVGWKLKVRITNSQGRRESVGWGGRQYEFIYFSYNINKCIKNYTAKINIVEPSCVLIYHIKTMHLKH